MKLRCPIPTRFLNNARTCLINQKFGQNPNFKINGVQIYDHRGHLGIDLYTLFPYKYKRRNQSFKNGRWTGFWVRERRTSSEAMGFIPLEAPHSGNLSTNVFHRDKTRGWGVFINWQEDGDEWRIILWHIERPWRSLGSFFRAFALTFRPEYVRAGSIVAIAGNTGYSTAPHVHEELQKKVNGVWEPVDPLPYHDDNEIVFQYGVTGTREYYHKGKKITRAKAESIYSKLPTVVNN